MQKVLGILICIFISGCSTNQIVLNLQGVQPDKNILENPAQYKGKGQFYMKHIIDSRPDYKMNEVGTVHTGLFNKKTPILLNDNLETVVASTLKDRMSLRGFKITDSSKTATHNMVATIKNFKFTEKTAMTSETGICDMDVSFQILNKKLNQKIQMTGTARGEFPGIDVTDKASMALVSCIDIIVVKMIDSELL